MPKSLEIAPRYLSELLLFLRSRRTHVENILSPETTDPYEPWKAFVAGTAIVITVLALDAADGVRHFDRVVFFTILLCCSAAFILSFHFAARVLHGRASLTQTVGAGQYLSGFLIPVALLLDYVIVRTANSFPGVECHLGYFTVHHAIVPTIVNRIIVTIVIGTVLASLAFVAIRSFVLLADVERLGPGKTLVASLLGAIPVAVTYRWLEFRAHILSGHLHHIAKILTASQE